MKIKEIILEDKPVDKSKIPAETVNAVLRQEVIDKIGDPRHPAYREVNVDNVVQKAKPYYMKPMIGKGLAVDKAFDDLYPNIERPTGKKPKKSAEPTKKQDSDDYRKDRIGRTLKHQRYYNTRDDEPSKDLDTSTIDSTIAGVAGKAKDIAYSTIPGAEELGKAASIGVSAFKKGMNFSLPSNKGKFRKR